MPSSKAKSDLVVQGTWEDLLLMPGKLTKLVADGYAKRLHKDKNDRWVYEVQKQALEKARKEQEPPAG